MTPPYPHLIRTSHSIDHARYVELGAKGVARLMADVETEAMATAARVGITRVKVRTKRWDLDVGCVFTDYPMYLCGPGAARIETAEDVFRHVWHLDNPWAKYEIVVEDQDLFDAKEAEWMARLVAQAREKGLDSLVPQWAPNVVEMVKRAMAAS